MRIVWKQFDPDDEQHRGPTSKGTAKQVDVYAVQETGVIRTCVYSKSRKYKYVRHLGVLQWL